MTLVKQSTETHLYAILIDDTDFKTPETGIAFGSATVKYAKEGDSAFTTKTLASGDWDEIGDGVYRIKFSATELNTVGAFVFEVFATGTLRYFGKAEIFGDLFDDLATTLSNMSGAGFVSATDSLEAISGSLETDLAISGVTYIPTASQLRAEVFMVRGRDRVTNPISATIDVYDDAGNLVANATGSSSSPDARGVFTFVLNNVSLANNNVYTLDLSVTDATGTESDTYALPVHG